MSQPKIVDLADFRQTSTPRLDDSQPIVSQSWERTNSTTSITELSDLYALDQPAGFVANALARLTHIRQAIRTAKQGDAVDRDDAINTLKAELPSLFALKGWPDGALAVFVALHHALLNKKGLALDSDQFYAIERTINKLAESPFLSFDRALDLIDILRECGFETDPEEASLIFEMLNE